MTIDEALKIAASVLPEPGHGKLKVLDGSKPFTGKRAIRTVRGLHELDASQLQQAVLDVLNQLPTGGIVMTHHDPSLESAGFGVRTASKGNLKVHLIQMFDPATLNVYTHVVCWYEEVAEVPSEHTKKSILETAGQR